VQPSIPDYTGRTVGNWRLVSLLGAGTFGAVYLSDNLVIRGRQAAVKVLHPHMAVEPDIQRRFLNEASAASQADHENIVQVFDGNVDDDGLCYLVMEFLRGGITLQKRLATGPLDIPRVCDLGAQIAGALQAAHAHQIVHRDLKPENIILVPRSHHPEFVKVLDFGVAKLRGVGAGTGERK
jgi:serine/threonine-protein kinase